MLDQLGFPYIRSSETETAIENGEFYQAALAAHEEQFLIITSELCNRRPLGSHYANRLRNDS